MPFVVIQGHGSSLIRREILIYWFRCFETNQPMTGYMEVKSLGKTPSGSFYLEIKHHHSSILGLPKVFKGEVTQPGTVSTYLGEFILEACKPFNDIIHLSTNDSADIGAGAIFVCIVPVVTIKHQPHGTIMTYPRTGLG